MQVTAVTDEMATYRAAWERREAAETGALARRAERARALATEAARVLRQEFGAQQVWLFGSLARGEFGRGSDVDLAVLGLDGRHFYAVVGRLAALDPDLELDLLDLEVASPTLRRAVETDGVPL